MEMYGIEVSYETIAEVINRLNTLIDCKYMKTFTIPNVNQYNVDLPLDEIEKIFNILVMHRAIEKIYYIQHTICDNIISESYNSENKLLKAIHKEDSTCPLCTSLVKMNCKIIIKYKEGKRYLNINELLA